MTDKRRKYLIITKEDADLIAKVWREETHGLTDEEFTAYGRIAVRFQDDTGADIEEIVAKLLRFQPCHASLVEGQPCGPSWRGPKLGRRLRRLLERARGERPPGPGQR